MSLATLISASIYTFSNLWNQNPNSLFIYRRRSSSEEVTERSHTHQPFPNGGSGISQFFALNTALLNLNIKTLSTKQRCYTFQNKEKKNLKLTLCGEAISISERTKKTPSGGKVMTLLRIRLFTSITCKTSPAVVPNKPAFSMMNSCSFSVVHRSRQVEDRDSPVVMELRPITAMDSMASTIASRFVASFWVLTPRSSSEISSSSFRLARCAGFAKIEQLVRKPPRRLLRSGGGGHADESASAMFANCNFHG